MSRVAAFLRGMNLGNRRIKNPALKAEFEQMGFADVATFRASGNVIFRAKGGSGPALEERIETGLAESLGYDVPVFLRDVAELAEIAAQKPFPSQRVAASKGKLQVVLLGRNPSARTAKSVLDLATDDDLLTSVAGDIADGGAGVQRFVRTRAHVVGDAV